MAVLNGAAGVAQARLLAGDTETIVNNQGLSDTQWLALGNEAMYYWFDVIHPRLIEVGPLTLSQGLAEMTVAVYAEIVDLGRSTDVLNAIYYPPLEKLPPSVVRRRLSQNLTIGTPAAWAVLKSDGGTGTHRLYFDRVADVSYNYSAIARNEPIAMGLGTSPDCTDSESYHIWRIAAIWGAALIGEDTDYISELMTGLPEEVAMKMVKTRYLMRPKSEMAEVPA